MTIRELIQVYTAHARRYYRKPKSRRPTTEAALIVQALRPLELLAGDLPADQMTAATISACRAWLLEHTQNCRKTINAKVARMIRMIAWACEPEQSLLDPMVLARVRCIRPLQYGRSGAPESKGLTAASPDQITDLLACLFEIAGPMTPAVRKARLRLATMVELQLESGMRSGELCSMAIEHLARQDGAWVYRPAEHKTEHKGRQRVVLIVGTGERLLTRWIADQQITAGPIFAMTPDSYRQAIQRALKRSGLARWTPHQLRHAMAARTRSEYDLDMVQALLGHASSRTSEHYAPMQIDASIIRRLRDR